MKRLTRPGNRTEKAAPALSAVAGGVMSLGGYEIWDGAI